MAILLNSPEYALCQFWLKLAQCLWRFLEFSVFSVLLFSSLGEGCGATLEKELDLPLVKDIQRFWMEMLTERQLTNNIDRKSSLNLLFGFGEV